MHLLRYFVKYTVIYSQFNTQTGCSKCPPYAWIHFLTCDQRTCNVTKRCSIVDAFCSTENSLEQFFCRIHLRTFIAGWNSADGLILTSI